MTGCALHMCIEGAVLEHVLRDGPAWEASSAERFELFAMAVTKRKPKKAMKRLGAKKVKQMERLVSEGEVLNAEESTAYRALAARANYLTLDRPDTGFSTK